MILKQIKLSKLSQERLSRMKGKTGIQNWNILCRWALCLSLAELSQPAAERISQDSNVEMTWHVFGGEYHEVYEALIKQRCINDGLGTDEETLKQQFRLHLARGISYLSATNYVRSIEELFARANKMVNP